MNAKVLAAAVALAVAASSQALAQRAASPSNARDSYGQSRQLRSANPSNDVYVNGQYVGSDPDPNIRAQLQRSYGNQGRW